MDAKVKKLEGMRDALQEERESFTAITLEIVELLKEKNRLLESSKPAKRAWRAGKCA